MREHDSPLLLPLPTHTHTMADTNAFAGYLIKNDGFHLDICACLGNYYKSTVWGKHLLGDQESFGRWKSDSS